MSTFLHWDTLFLLIAVIPVFIFFSVRMTRLSRKVKAKEEELIEIKQSVDAAAKVKSDFLVHMSHGIRTPMNAVTSFTEILTQRIAQNCSEELRSETEGILEIIRKSSQDLLTIVTDVLDYIKTDANQLEIESVPVSVKQIIHDVCLAEKQEVVQKHIDLQIRYSSEVPNLILSDPVRLRQILSNIVGNAVKFTDKGTISIVCGAQKNEGSELVADLPDGIKAADSKPFAASAVLLRIDVIDTGPGMSESVVKKLFQPFTHTGEPDFRKHRGSGLGLSIAMRLATLMDGTITVESTPGQGSRFSLLLNVYCPQGDSSVLAERTLQSKQDGRTAYDGSQLQAGLDIRMPKKHDTPMPSNQKPLAHARILVVEDMAVNQVVMSTLLREAGAKVEIADNGAHGVQKIMQDADSGLFFDVILMDMQMPVMDGYEATAFLRKQRYDRPIIAVTAHALTGDREKTLQAGCNDYIAKPVDNQTLIDTVKKYMT
ncbi:MAG: response regulator [Planctomycetaceae bacterium]|nr:response regulator [Planctomycetaceae bacterium]